MKLLGKLLAQKNVKSPEQQFDAEWNEMLTRFGIVTGVGAVKLDLMHPKTQKPIAPHAGLGATFADWQLISAPYDRRVLLFNLIFNTVLQTMKRWQVANYLTATRLPHKAIALLEQSEPDETETPEFCAAVAKANLSLLRQAEALPAAQSAVDAVPDNAHFRTVLADALHLSGRCEEARAIYTDLMANPDSDSGNNSDAGIAEMFRDLFARETGRVSSPVLALETGESLGDPAQAEEFWTLTETEFYDSPYFRMHHAYDLVKSGAVERGLAKLIALVKEIPGLREPSLNLMILFEHLNASGKQIMPEYQALVLQTIQENGWTADGLNLIKIELN